MEDPTFVPPCLLLKASPLLYGLVRDLISQLEAERKQTAQKMSRDNFSFEDTVRGTQFRRLLRLRTLSRFSGYLSSVVDADGVSPFVMYMQLKSLLGDFASLYPSRGEFDCPPYDHSKLYECFNGNDRVKGVLQAILELLPEIPDRFIRVPFEKVDGVLTANLKDIDLSGKADRFLAIKMRVSLTDLASHVEKRESFRVLPLSKSRQAIFGIPLRAELGPGGLPVQDDLHYFRLKIDERPDMWNEIKEERKLAVVPGVAAGLDWSADILAIYLPAPATPIP